jgi:hypothetical protein
MPPSGTTLALDRRAKDLTYLKHLSAFLLSGPDGIRTRDTMVGSYPTTCLSGP